jgi:hypothetical protein
VIIERPLAVKPIIQQQSLRGNHLIATGSQIMAAYYRKAAQESGNPPKPFSCLNLLFSIYLSGSSQRELLLRRLLLPLFAEGKTVV